LPAGAASNNRFSWLLNIFIFNSLRRICTRHPTFGETRLRMVRLRDKNPQISHPEPLCRAQKQIRPAGFVHKTPLLPFRPREEGAADRRCRPEGSQILVEQCGSTEVHCGSAPEAWRWEGIDRLPKKRQSERAASETAARPTKTTANLPADLYGQMWQLIARERGAGRRLTAQTVMVEALREYLKARKKGGAA
jgi:hypothetical protein